MYETVLPQVLDKFGIDYIDILDCQNGYRNEIWPVIKTDNTIISAIFYKREDGILKRIERTNRSSEHLATKGMPTRVRLDDRILKITFGDKSVYVCVYNYLPGRTIPWEAYTMKHIKILGKVMSDMHSNLADLNYEDYDSVYDEYAGTNLRMMSYFSDKNIYHAIRTKLKIGIDISKIDTNLRLLHKLKQGENQQVLHMDFVRGNVLFNDSNSYKSPLSISGILDFEKTAYGHPVMDIARTLAFLLVDCKYKENSKVVKYFLYSGYKKRGLCNDIGNISERNTLIEMFLLYDFYKFLRHNPYESLQQNEHYLRTRDILIERGVISY